MEKPIIGISLSGILIKKGPWKKAHDSGIRELAEKSGISEVLKGIDSSDYFGYVEKALEAIYPELSVEERIKKRREDYLERVLLTIRDNPSQINEDVIEYLKEITKKYSFVLITAGIKSFVEGVLDMADSSEIFDYLGVSNSYEKDDKRKVFERVIEEFGKPIYFLGSSRSKDICNEFGIGFVEISDENTFDDLKGFFEGLEK